MTPILLTTILMILALVLAASTLLLWMRNRTMEKMQSLKLPELPAPEIGELEVVAARGAVLAVYNHAFQDSAQRLIDISERSDDDLRRVYEHIETKTLAIALLPESDTVCVRILRPLSTRVREAIMEEIDTIRKSQHASAT